MLPFAANEQVLYSAVPEAHAGLSGREQRRNQSRLGPDVDASPSSLWGKKKSFVLFFFLKKEKKL